MARDLNIKGTEKQDFSTYAEKDITKSNVNWADVASGLTTTLETIRDEREGRKAEIEKATREAQNKLNQLEPVENQTLGNLALDMSNSSAEALKVQNDLMKRGLLSPNDYMKYKQNVSDGWKNFNQSIKNWDTAYANAMERVQNEDASGQEIFQNELMESFGNLTNMQGYINPETGVMSLVKPNEDGSIPSDPSKHMNLNYINARMNQQVNRVDVSANAKKETDRLATVIQAEIGTRQSLNTYEDFRLIKDEDGVSQFDKLIGNVVDAQTAIPTNVGSILSDNVTGYSFTQDSEEAKKDSKKILLVSTDGTGRLEPQITDEQMKVAKNYVREVMESQLDQKHGYVKGHQVVRKTAADYGKEARESISAGYYESVDKLVTSDAETATAAANELIQAINKENEGKKGIAIITDIIRGDDGDFIIKREGKSDLLISGENAEDLRRGIYNAVTPKGVQNYNAARDSYGGKVGEEIGRGKAEGRGQTTSIPTFDYASPIMVDGSKVGATKYLEDELGTDLTDWINASPAEIASSFGNVIRDIIPKEMKNRLGGDALQITFPTSGVMRVTLGGTTHEVSDIFGKNSNTSGIFEDIKTNVLEKERTRLNQSGASHTDQGNVSKMTFVEWKVQNPKGKLTEYKEYFNN